MSSTVSSLTAIMDKPLRCMGFPIIMFMNGAKSSGEEGLKDNRGKTAVAGDKENKYISQINRLKHRNEQLEREIEVLKKACALKMDLLHLQGIRKKK